MNRPEIDKTDILSEFAKIDARTNAALQDQRDSSVMRAEEREPQDDQGADQEIREESPVAEPLEAESYAIVGNTMAPARSIEQAPREQEQREHTSREQTLAPREQNIRQMRLAKERLEEENRELRRQQDEYTRRMLELNSRPLPQEQARANRNKDDLVEIGDIAELKEMLLQQRQERQEQQLEQQRQRLQAEVYHRVRQDLPDYDKVVNKENWELLKDHNPRSASLIENSTNDPYDLAFEAYDAVVRAGITKMPAYNEDRRKIAENKAKPRSSATVSPQKATSAIHEANAFYRGPTQQRKEELWEEMERSRG